MYTIVLHSLYKKDIQTSSCCTYFTFISFTYFTFILFSCFSFSYVLLSRQKCSHSKWTKNSIFHALSGSLWPRRHQTLCPKFSNFHPKTNETFFHFIWYLLKWNMYLFLWKFWYIWIRFFKRQKCHSIFGQNLKIQAIVTTKIVAFIQYNKALSLTLLFLLNVL